MPSSQFLAFGIGGGAGSPNTLTPTTYAGLTALLANGFQPGIAKSEEINTVLRQVTTGVAALASFAATHGPSDVLDNGVVADFRNALKAALDALYIQDLSGLTPNSAFIGGNQSKTTNGYQRLPGGLILQWGQYTSVMSPAVPVNVSFPLAHPNACFTVNLTALNPTNDGTADSWPELVSRNNSSFTAVAQNLGNAGSSLLMYGFSWMSIGH